MSIPLPVDFVARLEALAATYLGESDPIRQSGFSGGPERWRMERAPILQAIQTSGDFLDVGCANGFLLESLIRWGAETGLSLTPYGVDYSPGLIEIARQRLPMFAEHFFVGNAWGWVPPHRFQYVYAVFDCVPPIYFPTFVEHLATAVTAPGGRLILGAYGNRSRAESPAPIDQMLESIGYTVAGTAIGGASVMAHFAWIDV
jgi:SAM-dependent methyltransferase